VSRGTSDSFPSGEPVTSQEEPLLFCDTAMSGKAAHYATFVASYLLLGASPHTHCHGDRLFRARS